MLKNFPSRLKLSSKQASVSSLFWVALIFPQTLASSDEYQDVPPYTGNDLEPTLEASLDRHPRTAAAIRTDLIRNEIIPEFLLTPPRYEAFVTYYNGTEPNMGNTLRPEQVRWEPHAVTYKFKPESYYCIVMIGLDEPSKATPTKREFLHWIVGNILADTLIAGDQITEYYPVLPKEHTGRHRYLFLVYEQRGKIDFKEFPLTNRNDWGRANWSSRKFAEKYSLGEPYAVNFFYSEYTDLTFPPTTTEDEGVTKLYTASPIEF